MDKQANRVTRCLLLVSPLLFVILLIVRLPDITPADQAAIDEVALVRALAARRLIGDLAALLDGSMVMIPAGPFIMGSDSGHPHEQPSHVVTLDSFTIDRYEVTNAQYAVFIAAAGHDPPPYWPDGHMPPGRADNPVVGVGWDDADAYCRWARKRLPSEAEWEKACRGTEGSIYPWGDRWDARRANTGVKSTYPLDEYGRSAWDDMFTLLVEEAALLSRPHLDPVGMYPHGVSPYGVMDMAGNASEWVADWYNWADYRNWPTENPLNQWPPWNHSVRGSAWYQIYGTVDAVRMSSRCSARNSSHVSNDPRQGFRCARSAP